MNPETKVNLHPLQTGFNYQALQSPVSKSSLMRKQELILLV